MFQLPYEFDLPLKSGEHQAIALLGLDSNGVIGLVSVEILQGKGFLRFNKGEKFDRADGYLRAAHWQDILLQFEIRRQEIAALADRYASFQAETSVDAAICAARAEQLRGIAAQAVR